MQISTSFTSIRPASDNLSQAINTLRQAAQSWDQAEADHNTADRFLQRADDDFRNAEWPARNASFDDGRRDSSFEGRQLDNYFRSGERNIEGGQDGIRSADSNLQRTSQQIDSGQMTLDQLAQEYRQSGDARLADVQAAQQALISAEQSFAQVDNSWNSAQSALRFTDGEISRSQFDIREISFDRPGQDVSVYGRRVSNSINSIENDLRRSDSEMNRAGTNGTSGESSLDRAIAILQDAQAKG